MPKVIAVLIFDCAEEMDFAGPWEVLAAAADADEEWRVATAAADRDPVLCERG